MIYLASQSPRRKELLEQIGLSFQVVPSEYEEHNSQEMLPEELVRIQAEGKALALGVEYEDAWILGADTVVVLEGQILGKPKNEKEACDMLRQLSGKRHTVMTGVALVHGDQIWSETVHTDVWFKRLSEEEIKVYVESKEPLDKAGAYGIQGKGAVFVQRIYGSYSNVVGLPLETVYDMFRIAGVL